MLELLDGQTFYHGSYKCVESIDLSFCRPHKDFGQGFYLTTSLSQAEQFARLSLKKAARDGIAGASAAPCVSTYRFAAQDNLLFHAFEDADKEWLHFVAGNRRGELLGNGFERYQDMDVVAGKIANDQTAQTLQLYIAGAFGQPGTEAADRIAIDTLLPNRLENQFCFRTQRAIDCLSFAGCEQCDV